MRSTQLARNAVVPDANVQYVTILEPNSTMNLCSGMEEIELLKSKFKWLISIEK